MPSASSSLNRGGPALFPSQFARLQTLSQMQAVAMARQEQLFRAEGAAAQRLAAGDRARDAGDIRLATMVYVRLAASRPPNLSSKTARDRLAQLAEEARQKIQAVDARLAGETSLSRVSPGESANSASPTRLPAETILRAFEDYDEIASQYGKVPEVRREITSHLAKQRRKGEYAAVLNEAPAKELWEMGQQYEKDDQRCCAYWAYQEGARLVPAESALRAKQRFEAMKEDEQLVQSAKTCRELRRCHEIYRTATMLAEVKPDRALELYADILRRAPETSEIYRLARAEHEALGGKAPQ